MNTQSSEAGLYDLFGGGSYQHDMDIVRLNDIKEIGGYIEEYKEKTGNYPLMGKVDVPVYANIATKEQQELIKQAKSPPYEHSIVHVNDFIAELEKGLGRKITMPFDLQRMPNGRQNFYTYMVVDTTYYLAVHLYNAYPFTQKINDNWYKLEISNKPDASIPTWNYQGLMQNKQFSKAIAEPMNKPKYIKNLRKKIYNDIGF